jgi:DNA polymerase elongation subunit (family B)
MVRGYYDGKRFSEKVKYKPYLFIKSNTEKSTYTDYKGKISLAKVDFDSIKDAKEFMDRYSDVDNFDIYGMNKFQYTYINDEYPEGVPYDIKQMSIVSIDIEVASDNGFPYPESAANEVTAITLSKDGKYYVFGCGDYTTTNPNVRYAKCYSEEQLLHKFLDFWKVLDPDIITGWNVELFDIPYLYN